MRLDTSRALLRLKVCGGRQNPTAWSYPGAKSPYELISSYYSFYAHRRECFLDDEGVRPRAGLLLRRPVTDESVGP